MAAMPIYGKNPSKIFFSETNRLISRKLDVKHRWLKYFNVYINHDPVMTLTKFMARSTWVAYAFELGKLLKCHLKGKASRKLANGQNIEDSEKRKWPKGFICPCTGIKYHNIHTCLLTSICSRSQVSVWSSGYILHGHEDSEKRKWPKGFICPCTGIKYHNIHTCLLTSICSRSQVTIGPLVIYYMDMFS